MNSKMSGLLAGRVSKHRSEQRAKDRSVVRMMAIMQDRNGKEVPKEFLETGRTGRRNAMPDILNPQGSSTTTADLPERLQNLVTSDAGETTQPSTSTGPEQIVTGTEMKDGDHKPNASGS